MIEVGVIPDFQGPRFFHLGGVEITATEGPHIGHLLQVLKVHRPGVPEFLVLIG